MTQHRSNSKGHNKKDPELDLSLGQVLAASGATTLGALLVKVLDMWGTLLGTAVLSICTSIGAVLILRTMRRTSETVKQQITVLSRAAETRIQTGATVDLEAETVRIEPADEADRAAEADSGGAHSRKRTLLAILVSSVSVFALTMGALFLFGTLVDGDPVKYIVDERTTTVYVSDDQDGTDQSSDDMSGEDGTETPTEGATGDEQTEDDSTEEPTDEATGETPTEDEDDAGSGGDEADASPSPESQEQSATASESPADEE